MCVLFLVSVLTRLVVGLVTMRPVGVAVAFWVRVWRLRSVAVVVKARRSMAVMYSFILTVSFSVF